MTANRVVLVLDERTPAHCPFLRMLTITTPALDVRAMPSIAQASAFLIAQPVLAVLIAESFDGQAAASIAHRLRTLRSDTALFIRYGQNTPLEKTATVLTQQAPELARPGVSALSVLSRRERLVFDCIVRGETGAVSAQKLHLSVKTVETYRRRLMHKLLIFSVAELVCLAIRENVLTVADNSAKTMS